MLHCGSNQETVHIPPFSVFYSPCNYSILGCYIEGCSLFSSESLLWLQAQCCFVMSTALEMADCGRSLQQACPRGRDCISLFVCTSDMRDAL